MTVEKKGVLDEHYEEIGFGSITEIEKTRAVDFQIKNLPVGQMQVLTTNNRRYASHARACTSPAALVPQQS